MEVLDRCTGPGAYGYWGVTRKDDTITIRNADDLYANIPIHAPLFEAKLQRSGELRVAMTIVGRYVAERETVRALELQGDCSRATHVVAALTAGAFELSAGSGAAVGGDAQVGGAGVGARSSAKRETLNRDGDLGMCSKATTKDREPPEGCGALLRVEVVPISDAGAPRVVRRRHTAVGPGKVTIDYVSFTLDDARLEAELNQRIERVALDDSERYRIPEAESSWFLERTCDVVHVAPKGASILCTGTWFSGGAHPNHTASSLTVVWTDGRLHEVPLSALFLPGSGWEALLASQYTEALRARGASRVLDRTFAITPADLDVWAVDPDGLTIIFPENSAGTHAEGPYSVVLPWSRFRAVANVDGPLAALRERTVSRGP